MEVQSKVRSWSKVQRLYMTRDCSIRLHTNDTSLLVLPHTASRNLASTQPPLCAHVVSRYSPRGQNTAQARARNNMNAIKAAIQIVRGGSNESSRVMSSSLRTSILLSFFIHSCDPTSSIPTLRPNEAEEESPAACKRRRREGIQGGRSQGEKEYERMRRVF